MRLPIKVNFYYVGSVFLVIFGITSFLLFQNAGTSTYIGGDSHFETIPNSKNTFKFSYLYGSNKKPTCDQASVDEFVNSVNNPKQSIFNGVCRTLTGDKNAVYFGMNQLVCSNDPKTDGNQAKYSGAVLCKVPSYDACSPQQTIIGRTGQNKIQDDVTYVVPKGCKYATVKMWGAGGGSGSSKRSGGPGAFVQGVIPVESGETLHFSLGGAGQDYFFCGKYPVSNTVGYTGGKFGGGTGGYSFNGYSGGGGGGYSAVYRNVKLLKVTGKFPRYKFTYQNAPLYLMVAGGGGGASGDYGVNSIAGAGGAPVGLDASNAKTFFGKGATLSAGGVGGGTSKVTSNNGSNGKSLLGGTGGGSEVQKNQSGLGAGGGGGGWFGGGGGGFSTEANKSGDGGGGSSYATDVYVFSPQFQTSKTGTPANISDTDYKNFDPGWGFSRPAYGSNYVYAHPGDNSGNCAGDGLIVLNVE